MMNTFPLKHLLLYAKGWYQKSDDIWADLQKVFSADNYLGEKMSKTDILSVILSKCQALPNNRAFELSTIIFAIEPNSCWKYGYVVKGNPFDSETTAEYDYYTAILLYCVSELKFLEREHCGELPKPDFKNCLPKPKRSK